MTKRFKLLGLLLTASVIVVVVAHERKHDPPEKALVKEMQSLHFNVVKADCVALQDHMVVEIQLCKISAAAKNVFTPEGFTPEVAAKARAPSTEVKNLLPFIRDGDKT